MKKRIALILLAALLLLSAGCKKEPEPTTIRLPEEMLNPTETTMPAEETLETTAPQKETTPVETRPNLSVEPDYDYYRSLLTSDSRGIWLRRALGCVFSTAEELNLEQFFANGISDISWDTVSGETVDLLMKQGFSQSTELQGMPVADMDQALKATFGLPLADVETPMPKSWTYVSADNCYYSNHHPRGTVTDIEITLIEITRDNTVQIFYNIYAGEAMDAAGKTYYEDEMLLTLRYMPNDTWQVVSNTPVPSK